MTHPVDDDRPGDAGLAAVAHAVAGPRARVTAVEALTGGLDARTDAVLLEPGGWVVLKRSRTPEPRSLVGEWDRLLASEPVAVPTPVPLALDRSGEWFGRPALVMSRLRGSARVHRSDGPWVGRLAATVAAVHDVPIGPEDAARLGRGHAGAVWAPWPEGSTPPSGPLAALVAATASLRADLPTTSRDEVLLHHDLHQRNVLWHDGRVSGLVDWNEACLGPAACDVAYTSAALAMVLGPAVADRFVAAYRAVSPARLHDLARWQALWIVTDLRWLTSWAEGWAALGATDLAPPVLGRRLHAFAARVADRL